jgi:protein-glutamine gamma-glutamyltransferase
VNGFLGGEWNELRKGVTVRENRAHSWIEAYLGDDGWVRVDATPALDRPAHMGVLRQFVDAAELFWGRWVVEYSASQQLLLAQRLGQKLGFGSHPRFYGGREPHLSKKQALAVAAFVLAVIVVVTQRKRLLRWPRQQKRLSAGEHEGRPVERLYQATLRRLATSGIPRRPCETPHEYAKRLGELPCDGLHILARLTDAYTSSRYGNVDPGPEVLAELRQDSKQIGLPS